MIKKIKIESNINQRLDKFLKKNFTSLTQSFIEKNIRKKNILVNNEKCLSKKILKQNDQINILNYHPDIYKNRIVFKRNINISKSQIDLFKKSIIYEEKNFLILNKWSGISSQGGTKIKISIDDIIKRMSPEYRLVHRLDLDTSGLLIISKNLEYAQIFGKLFKSNNINKYYFAICEGKPKYNESSVDLKINTKSNNTTSDTKTFFKALNYKNGISQILFEPKTGKTHQLRIVAKNLGCPIVGDKKYNIKSKYNKTKLKLHAFKISFKIKSKNYKFSSKIPSYFHEFARFNKINLVSKIS